MKELINKLLKKYIEFELRNKINTHHYKFNKGDIVKYNWKAKIMIYSAIKDKLKPMEVLNQCYSDGSGLDFINGDSCAAYWVRKLILKSILNKM